MRKLTRNALTVTAVAASAIALTSVPASAAGTWTVSPGGNISGSNTRPLTAVDTTTGSPVVCDVSTATGTAQSGSGLSGDGIASLTDVQFSTPGNPNDWCTGPVGIVVQVTATNLPWTFNAASYDSASGVTSGSLTGVSATIHGSDECDASITGPGGAPGTIEGSYTNGANTLGVTGGNLEVTTVDADCDPSLIGVGDQVVLDGEYTVTPGQTITSP
ncbi:hypothetical protein E1293_27000 [Actinomadura darangshiensis]|uniref:Secreted protein n=1 Tax=Actinomadura darangshiensis TaxID=705336 RepID=A0A4R5ATG0_9ACTN|nr:hypothetical protein [Actinomadura darangshiensis]TDD76558.1 hypothetical protein E1293_27000 [Actinomadura darangshiensis]